MAPALKATAEENIKYLMLVIQSSSDFKPDYHQVAFKAGVNNANSAQKKFKKFVEDAGFNLVNGVVVDAGGDGKAPASSPKTPKKATPKKNGTPASKKRKTTHEESEEVGTEDAKSEVAVKDEVNDESNGEEKGAIDATN